MSCFWRPALSALLLVAPYSSTARSQPRADVATAPDSATVLAKARAAQADFERLRRRQLSRVLSSRSGPCDETVGRYCYWDDADTSESTLPEPLPKESPRTVEARAALLAVLDSATTRLPGDDWLAGQQVRYLIESGASAIAEGRARSCRGTPWWCSALLGLVHHAAWRYPSADSAFAAAIATMPEAERCAWTDLTELLAEPVRDAYENASCAERGRINARIWWLADPLHLRPGNDRRTEHYARLVIDRLQRRAASGYGVTWRDDLGELLRRYGWPSHFAQSIPQPGRTEPPGILAYDASPSYHFLADGDPRDSIRDMSASRWRLRPLRPRERYAPPYATFATGRTLTALFRRGDSVLLVAAYDASGDTLMPGARLTAALTASTSADSILAQHVDHSATCRGTLLVNVPNMPALAAVEIIGGNRIHRARLAVALADAGPQRVRISDVAFFEPGDSLPRNLGEFLSVATASSSFPRDAKLGLFWELYDVSVADADLSLRVQVIREGRSWMRRAGERVGLVGRQGARGFGWREGDRGDGGVAPRAVVVDLAGLDPGEYRIEVGLARGSATPVVVSRRLTITP